MPRISVIVPVYNVESYLASCLDSVRRQDMDDIEIVCVNDGSTDRSADVLALFAEAEPRIVVVDKKNGGLSSARNAGIRAATGEYLCFLDSDDLLEKNACSTIVAAFEGTGAEVVTYGGAAYPEQRGYAWLDEVLSPRGVEYAEFDPDLLFEENSSPFVWRTACRRSFLEKSGLLFDETLPYGEDQVFLSAVYPRSRYTALIPDKLVRYRVLREGSFMHSRLRNPEKMAYDHIAITERVLKDWKAIGFLDRYPTEAMDWAVHFALLRIMQLDEEYRLHALDAFASTVRATFNEGFLVEYANAGSSRLMAKAALVDRSFAIGNKRRRAVYSHLVAKEGFAATVGIVLTQAFGGRAVGRAVKAVRLTLPLSERSARKHAALADWEEADRFDRTQSLQLVTLEVARLRDRA